MPVGADGHPAANPERPLQRRSSRRCRGTRIGWLHQRRTGPDLSLRPSHEIGGSRLSCAEQPQPWPLVD